jgi:hypothetical protein
VSGHWYAQARKAYEANPTAENATNCAAAALADSIDAEIVASLRSMNVVQHDPTWEKCLRRWATKHRGPGCPVFFSAASLWYEEG